MIRDAAERVPAAKGIVYLVGAGPGDADLFTLRGVELLGRADVVIYDGLVNRELLRFAPPTAEIIYGGKHDRTRCVSQAELNALMLAKAREGHRVQPIAAMLTAHGRSPDSPVAVVSRGTAARQQTVVGTLATVVELAQQAGISPPAVTIIGEVVTRRERLNWFEQRPLFGRRVAVTQRSDLAQPLLGALRERGAKVLEVPVTRWAPHPDRAN